MVIADVGWRLQLLKIKLINHSICMDRMIQMPVRTDISWQLNTLSYQAIFGLEYVAPDVKHLRRLGSRKKQLIHIMNEFRWNFPDGAGRGSGL